MSTKNRAFHVKGVPFDFVGHVANFGLQNSCVTSLKTVGETRGQVAATCLSPLFFLFMCARAVTAVQNVILLPLVSVSAAFFYVCTCCDSVPAIRALHVYRT